MRIDVKFSEDTTRIDAKFGELTEIKDGYTQEELDSKVAAAEASGIETGKTAERKRFWDGYLKDSNVTYGGINFRGVGWNDDTFYPNQDIVPLGEQGGFFRYCRISDLEGRLEECGVTLDTSQVTDMNSFFGESRLVYVPALDMTKITTESAAHGTFSGCTRLVSIRKLIVSENTMFKSNAFGNCTKLEHIVIDGTIAKNGFAVHYSKLLSHDSLMSIINALKDYSADTSGTVWEVTLGADNIAKLTSDELKIAYDKGWVVG